MPRKRKGKIQASQSITTATPFIAKCSGCSIKNELHACGICGLAECMVCIEKHREADRLFAREANLEAKDDSLYQETDLKFKVCEKCPTATSTSLQVLQVTHDNAANKMNVEHEADKQILTELKAPQKSPTTKCQIVPAIVESKPSHLRFREPKQRCVENVILVWYDPNLNSDEDERQTRKTISELQHIINWNLLFNDHMTCVEFLNQLIKDQHVFLVVSSSTSISDARSMIYSIHHLVSIDSIYVMGTAGIHEHYPRKVKSGFIDTAALGEQLQKDTKQCEQDLVRINEQGGSSFLYSQLLKEILVENVDESALFVKIYALFCRMNYNGNVQELQMINEFEQTYGKGQHYSPIWWYTRRCFVSRTLTRAIHLLDVEILCVIHFFIRDLHNQLVKIHAENSKYEKPLIVYRGQGMQRDDFERIVQKKETCIAFNNFLLTTTDRQAALGSAQNAFDRNLTAILFEMHVDPSLEGISPFARIGQLSCAKKNKNQILFSMHSIFRLEAVEQSDSGIWNVKLKLSNTPNDPFIDQMREKTQGQNVIFRMGALFIEMNEFDKAREIYSSLLHGGVAKDDFHTQVHLHNRLAFIFKQIDKTDLSQYHYNECVNLTKKYATVNALECANIQDTDWSEILDDEKTQRQQLASRSADEDSKRLEKEFWNSEFGRTNQTQQQALDFLKQSVQREHHRHLDLIQQLKKTPRVVVQVGGDGCGRLAVSKSSILFSPSDTTIMLSPLPSYELYHINRDGDKTQIKLNNEKRIGIQAICWSFYLDRFIVLTADKIKKVYIFDEKKTTTNSSQHIEGIPDSGDREYESCTCSDQIFLVTYKGFNPVIDQWQLSDWKRTKLWKPPMSCENLEMIQHIRFSQNNSLHVGLIINHFETYRFELRNYLTMECLQTVDFKESNQIDTPVPISLSTGEWLFTATMITFISKNVIGRLPIKYHDNVKNAIQFEQDCLIVKTTDGKLNFHDYHD